MRSTPDAAAMKRIAAAHGFRLEIKPAGMLLTMPWTRRTERGDMIHGESEIPICTPRDLWRELGY